ncbi:hypothetical protein [Hallella bergensis]|uniref:hypothetical protein n=1 Tax=Hallella bergensis TaxID=242750 RepID=UPI0023F1FFED|nr:hypothetical protein [Hallella bergensis]
MDKELKKVRCIQLNEETAELFNCKQMLDECYDKLAKVHEDIIGYESGFDDKIASGYVIMKNLILDLLTKQIDTNSTESHCKFI